MRKLSKNLSLHCWTLLVECFPKKIWKCDLILSMVTEGCDKSRTQRTNMRQQICCVHPVYGSRTQFYTPITLFLLSLVYFDPVFFFIGWKLFCMFLSQSFDLNISAMFNRFHLCFCNVDQIDFVNFINSMLSFTILGSPPYTHPLNQLLPFTMIEKKLFLQENSLMFFQITTLRLM